jgi:hypothetical protein
MRAIPISESDGSEPLPICRAQREWLVSRYKSEAMLALKFFSNDVPVPEADRQTDQKAIEHVRKCPKCRAWIHSVVPADVLRRQSRLTRYCCAGMYVAVEEADERSMNRVTFEMFRGEDPCWIFDGKRKFASYRPWCGKKLPDKQFIVDDNAA